VSDAAWRGKCSKRRADSEGKLGAGSSSGGAKSSSRYGPARIHRPDQRRRQGYREWKPWSEGRRCNELTGLAGVDRCKAARSRGPTLRRALAPRAKTFPRAVGPLPLAAFRPRLLPRVLTRRHLPARASVTVPLRVRWIALGKDPKRAGTA